MWEILFREMNEAALSTDLQLYDEAIHQLANRVDPSPGYVLLRRQSNRFVITSINRGSIEIVGGILIAAGWAFKKFVEPGWEKSKAKKGWDDGVANMIDKSLPILKEQIDVRVAHRLKQLRIRRVAVRPPNDAFLQLGDNTELNTELVYDKPKQIEH
jgi:hypothetical protein